MYCTQVAILTFTCLLYFTLLVIVKFGMVSPTVCQILRLVVHIWEIEFQSKKHHMSQNLQSFYSKGANFMFYFSEFFCGLCRVPSEILEPLVLKLLVRSQISLGYGTDCPTRKVSASLSLSLSFRTPYNRCSAGAQPVMFGPEPEHRIEALYVMAILSPFVAGFCCSFHHFLEDETAVLTVCKLWNVTRWRHKLGQFGIFEKFGGISSSHAFDPSLS